jgi:pimeloyl-ACP methyl ester carboxylesterase
VVPTREPAVAVTIQTSAAVPRWTEIDWRPHSHDARVLGRRLRYVDYGHGPPILFVHGLGGCWQWWLETMPDLGRRYRTIAIDLPGFGDSEPLPSPGEMPAHVDTLRALLDALELDRVMLVGHSMGGLISMLFATEHGERLSGLVPVCAGGVELSPARLAVIVRGFLLFNSWFKRPSVSRAFTRRPRLRRSLFTGVTGNPRSLAPELAAELIPRLSSAPGFADAVLAAGSVANSIDPARITTKSLLIWGARDPIVPVSRARKLAAAMSNARIEVLEGVGHCPMFEAAPQFNRLLADFAASCYA